MRFAGSLARREGADAVDELIPEYMRGSIMSSSKTQRYSRTFGDRMVLRRCINVDCGSLSMCAPYPIWTIINNGCYESAAKKFSVATSPAKHPTVQFDAGPANTTTTARKRAEILSIQMAWVT
jgi:hypothetical protein